MVGLRPESWQEHARHGQGTSQGWAQQCRQGSLLLIILFLAIACCSFRLLTCPCRRQVCTAGCDLCRLGQEHIGLQRAFREVSSRSLARR